MAIKHFSRLEANKEVRRILVRNGVDTARIQFSCHGRAVNFTGILLKEGGKELEIHNVENVFQSLFRLGFQVHCEIENWTISEGMISKKSQKNSGVSQTKTEKANYSSNQGMELDADEFLGIEKKKKSL